MGGKSKRYFQSSRGRSRSRSPDSRSHKSSYSAHLHKSEPKSRLHYENKSASERLKKSIQDQLKSKSKASITTPPQPPPPPLLSVEEQVKRANAIEEINYNPFKPKTFISTRNGTNNSINLLDIPLPKDHNSWRDNPKLLIDSSLYIGSAEDRKNKWYDNLQAMRKQLLKNET